MLKNKLKPAVIKIGFLIAALIAVFFAVGFLFRILKTSENFRIKDIIIFDQEKEAFSYLLGQNIFNIDLKKESSYILGLYPGHKRVKVIKIFPNRLFITFIRRLPIAYVKLYRDFFIDEEFVLFDSHQKHVYDLPVIAGLETRIFGAKPGTRYNVAELNYALSVLEEIRGSRALNNFKIKRIDVKNLADTCCFFSFILRPAGFTHQNVAPEVAVLEVKFGYDNIKQKIRLLAGLIARFDKELNNIKYIDLRFKDPVIKFKDAK